MIVSVCANVALDITYTVPALVPGETHRVTTARERAGGKGTNVARVLHQLGADVVLCGFAGDATGDAIRADLAASGLDHRLTPIGAATRRSVAVVAEDQATVFNEAGPSISDDDWKRLVAEVDASLTGARVLALSGSLPPGAPIDGYAQLVTLARRRGVPAIVDASGAVLSAALAVSPDVVKPNAAEAAQLLGRRVATRDDAVFAARELVRRGALASVISRGAHGLVAVREGEVFEVSLPQRITGNATGAGDALAAALAHGLETDRDWCESLRDAAAIAAAAVAVPVAGEFVVAEAERLRPAIEIRRLS